MFEVLSVTKYEHLSWKKFESRFARLLGLAPSANANPSGFHINFFYQQMLIVSFLSGGMELTIFSSFPFILITQSTLYLRFPHQYICIRKIIEEKKQVKNFRFLFNLNSKLFPQTHFLFTVANTCKSHL